MKKYESIIENLFHLFRSIENIKTQANPYFLYGHLILSGDGIRIRFHFEARRFQNLHFFLLQASINMYSNN